VARARPLSSDRSVESVGEAKAFASQRERLNMSIRTRSHQGHSDSSCRIGFNSRGDGKIADASFEKEALDDRNG
jgi:hypothetical protein